MVTLEAPFIAKKVMPGQFVIIRLDELGERVPLTVADFDREKGTLTLVFQTVGYSTKKFAAMEIGDSILNVVGPLGVPTEFGNPKKAIVIGGGVGCAIAYPQAKALYNMGVKTDVIAGFRSKDEHPIPQKENTIKQITYFLGEYSNQEFTYQKDELTNAMLVDYETAMSLFQFDSSKRIWKH